MCALTFVKRVRANQCQAAVPSLVGPSQRMSTRSLHSILWQRCYARNSRTKRRCLSNNILSYMILSFIYFHILILDISAGLSVPHTDDMHFFFNIVINEKYQLIFTI